MKKYPCLSKNGVLERTAPCVKLDNILKYFSHFPRKQDFDISVCMKYQILFSGKSKKSPISHLLNLPRDCYRLKNNNYVLKQRNNNRRNK